MSDYNSNLIEAVETARARADDVTCGLSAQRRDYGDGVYSWLVSFDDDPAAFMTVISSDDESTQSDAQIASIIEGCWDAEWDDNQVERPIGDFSHGSSDWSQS